MRTGEQAMGTRARSMLWWHPAVAVEEVDRRGFPGVAATPAIPIGPALAVQRFPELGAMAPDRVPEVMFGKLWGAIFSAAMLDGLVPTALDWRPDLVIADAADFSGHVLAAELGVPSITKG